MDQTLARQVLDEAETDLVNLTKRQRIEAAGKMGRTGDPATSSLDLLDRIEISPMAIGRCAPDSITHDKKIIQIMDGKIFLPPNPYDPDVMGHENAFRNRFLAAFYQLRRIRSAPAANLYYRWTNNESEPDLARSHTIRRSRNHRNEKEEAGLSVAIGPWYFLHHQYCYFVSGKNVGPGSGDLEPVLDISTLEVHSELLSRRTVLRNFYEDNGLRIAKMSTKSRVSEVDLLGLLLGMLP